jgi:ATP/maltotriose-dependent transcriptional regulator MalT
LQILSTKLSIPPQRSRLVLRPRLIQKLNQGSECGFTLVSAPAGYGKSTLLSAWLTRIEYPATWLTLDDRDNDLSRFLSYLVAACRKIDILDDKSFENQIGIYQAVDYETPLTELINHLNQLKLPVFLVMDDYHVIRNQDVHQAVNFLLENRPVSLNLIISTRADPPLHLAKIRARSAMVEIRMADLRFTQQEASHFLEHTMGLKVSEVDVERITQRTEGWIAGLQIAALSMLNSNDIPAFITTLTGTHHYIFDYLLEEIIVKQTVEVQRFLLYTSIFDQMTAPLCDALFVGTELTDSIPSSSIMLEELEHANLFIIPLDQEHRFYRYHPLFIELLRSYLQKKEPHQISILNTLASNWFEKQGMVADAIRHSFKANDWNRVVRLISANIFALLEQNELTGVARQIDNLTKEKSPARPWLLVGRAWLAAYTGQLSSVEPILKMIEAEIDNLSSELELQNLGGHIAAVRAYANWIGGQRDIAANAAQTALVWLPDSERLIRCQASTLLGLAHHDFNEKAKALKQALIYARECHTSHVTIFAYGCWAWMLVMQGKLHEAYAACLEVLDQTQLRNSYQSFPTLSHVYTTMSFILLEWNDLEGALKYAKDAVHLAHRWEQADALHFALNNLGYVLFALGDVKGAFEVLDQEWQVARRTSIWFEEITLSQEIEWYLAQNNLEAVINCLRRARVEIDDSSGMPLRTFTSGLLPLVFIQILLYQERYSSALKQIDFFINEMRKNDIGHYIILLNKWQALAYQGLQQEVEAQEALKQALIRAQPENYIRMFIQKEPGLQELLYHAHKVGIMPDYIDRLLQAFEQDGKEQTSCVRPSPELIEALSKREMDVLSLLAEGRSDKLIAQDLVIARETVHKHLKNIYGKLDVHSRTEAVARARQLNLL